MNCRVCQNGLTARVCPVCGFDSESVDASKPNVVLAARESFRARSTQARVNISTWDKWRPWAAVLLGLFLFATWMRACSSPGWPFWG
jgi:hypothetical protein